MDFNFKIKKNFANEKEGFREELKNNNDFRSALYFVTVAIIIFIFGSILNLFKNNPIELLGEFLMFFSGFMILFSFLALILVYNEFSDEYNKAHYKGKGYYETNKMIVHAVNKNYTDTIEPRLKNVEIEYSFLDDLDKHCKIYLNGNGKGRDLQTGDIFTIKTEDIIYHNDFSKTLTFKDIQNKYKYEILNDSKKLSLS